MQDLHLGSTVLDVLRELDTNLNAVLLPFYKPYGITVMQARVMMEISRLEPVAIGELADRIGMARANASTLCKRLESLGVAERSRGKLDERVVKISLTPQGRKILSNVEEAIRESGRQKFGKLSEQERADILNSLGKLNQLLRQIAQSEKVDV